MKLEIKITDVQKERLKRQALAGGFFRKPARQGKPWNKEEERDAVLFAVNTLVRYVTSVETAKNDPA